MSQPAHDTSPLMLAIRPEQIAYIEFTSERCLLASGNALHHWQKSAAEESNDV